GDPSAAQLTPPPRLRWLSDPGWVSFGLTREIAANYMLLHEHYLDLTYTLVVHPEVVPPGIERLPPPRDVEVSETSVSFSRSFSAVPPADWEAEATGLPRDRSCERREYETFLSPAVHVGRWEIHADDVHELVRIQAFTPAGESATPVFLHLARNYALDRAVIKGRLRTMFQDLRVSDAA